MHHAKRCGMVLAVIALAAAGCVLTGCRTSMSSGLPRHISTVEVPIFQNRTMYKSVEAWLTREIIDAVNADPNVRVVSRNGDAVITGEIVDVRREVLRDNSYGQPSTVRIVLDIRYSFYDNVRRQYIIENQRMSSVETGASPGLYEKMRNEESETGERGAARQAAAEIVRRTIGMW